MTDDDPLLRPRPIDLPTMLAARRPDRHRRRRCRQDLRRTRRSRRLAGVARAAARSGATAPASGTPSTTPPTACVGAVGEHVLQRRASCGCGTSGSSTTPTQRVHVDGFLADDRRPLRRVRRRRAVAGVPDHRHRRAHPVRLLPRRARASAELVRRLPATAASACSWTTTRGTPRPSDAARPPRRLVAALVADLGADGVFLDTMSEGGRRAAGGAGRAAIRHRCSRASRRCPLERIADHQASWAQWFADSPCPGCCGRTGSSVATCSTTPGGGTTTTATSCSRAG